MCNKYLLGVDYGGGASKATLLSDKGKIVATAQKEYITYYPRNGWTEQSPHDFYNALIYHVDYLLKSTGISAKDIAAVSFDAATHTAILTDEYGEPVRNAIHWTDLRSAGQAAWLKKNYNDLIISESLNAPSVAWTLPHLMWLKENEPVIFKKFSRIYFVKDYVRQRLTGDFLTDSIDAIGSMLMSVKDNCWSKQLCDLAGIDIAVLPKIVKPSDIAGYVTEKAARETGLSEGTPVIVGTTDTALEVYASGAITPGDVTVKLASTGRICPITTEPILSPMFFNYRHIIPGLWYPGTGTRACAASNRWFRDTLSGGDIRQAESERTDPYLLMDHKAASVPAGADGLLYHPYLLGELTPYFDESLRASFTGVSSFHKKGHFNRAVLEGVGYSLKDCFELIRSRNIVMERIRIIGGGAKSALWCQIMSDMFGIELIKTENNDSSLGSAMLAGVAAGVFSSFGESVEKCVSVQKIVKPDFANNKIYERQFAFYKKIHDALAPIYREMQK